MRDGRACVMQKKTPGRVLPRRATALAAVGNESDRDFRVRLSNGAEAARKCDSVCAHASDVTKCAVLNCVAM